MSATGITEDGVRSEQADSTEAGEVRNSRRRGGPLACPNVAATRCRIEVPAVGVFHQLSGF
jgi:hypothetical protein